MRIRNIVYLVCPVAAGTVLFWASTDETGFSLTSFLILALLVILVVAAAASGTHWFYEGKPWTHIAAGSYNVQTAKRYEDYWLIFVTRSRRRDVEGPILTYQLPAEVVEVDQMNFADPPKLEVRKRGSLTRVVLQLPKPPELKKTGGAGSA